MIFNTFTVSILLWSIKEIYPVPLEVVERADFSSKDQDDHKPVIPIIPSPKNDNVNIDSTNTDNTQNSDPSPLSKNDKDSELEAFLSGLDNPVDSGTSSSHGGSIHTSNGFHNEHHVIKPVKEIKNERVENKMSSDNSKSVMNHNADILQNTNNDKHFPNGDGLQKDINNGVPHFSNGDGLQKDTNNDDQHSSDGDIVQKDINNSDPNTSNGNPNTNILRKDINDSDKDINDNHKDIYSSGPEKPIKVTNDIEKVFGPAPKDKNENEFISKPLDNNEHKDHIEETVGAGKKDTNIDQDKNPLDDVSIDHRSAVNSQPVGFFQRFLGDENHPLGYLGKELKNVLGSILNGFQELTGLGPRRVGSGGILGNRQIGDNTDPYHKNMAEGRPPVGQGNIPFREEIRPTNNGIGNGMVYGRGHVGGGMGNMDGERENIGRYPGIPNRGMGNNGENVGRNPSGYNHGMEYMNGGMPPVYPGFNRGSPSGERSWNYPRQEGRMENSNQHEYFNGNMRWFRPQNGPGPGLLNNPDELAA